MFTCLQHNPNLNRVPPSCITQLQRTTSSRSAQACKHTVAEGCVGMRHRAARVARCFAYILQYDPNPSPSPSGALAPNGGPTSRCDEGVYSYHRIMAQGLLIYEALVLEVRTHSLSQGQRRVGVKRIRCVGGTIRIISMVLYNQGLKHVCTTVMMQVVASWDMSAGLVVSASR